MSRSLPTFAPLAEESLLVTRHPTPPPQVSAALGDLAGYLNFSNGAADARFRRQTNELYRVIESAGEETGRPWELIRHWLDERLAALRTTEAAFRETQQAESVIGLVFDRLLPAYRMFHRDLLFHQPDEALWRPLVIARACEEVLRAGSPWDEPERIIPAAIAQLNDYLGYRPVAVLNTPHKIEPRAHERVCPVPLYWRDVGVATGRYAELIEQALTILRATDRDISELAWFDLDRMTELALDPRAYDFDHPVNQRPVNHFGGWDTHRIDQRGYFNRFVLREVTLEAIWQRVLSAADRVPFPESLFEAGAVLASTLLMASGVTGGAPDTHSSDMTLAKLLPRIVACRDAFYERLLASVPGPHGERLRREAELTRQPFGAARQQLNQRLARIRAAQLQHVHLAQLFARMGYAEASSRQAQIVPVASARMLCEIDGQLTAAQQALERGRPGETAERLPEIENTLQRAIECGALVDPWNILGFQGQFSLFPAVENTIRDHRVDVLIRLVRQVFSLYAKASAEAAARGEAALDAQLRHSLERLADWWDQFASIEVASVERVSGREAAASAERVASALAAWHAAGESAGDLAFWREHVAEFGTAKSYALIVDVLLDHGDFIASSALLVQWLGQAPEVPLVDGAYSFHDRAIRWMTRLWDVERPPLTESGEARDVAWRWSVARKFFDFLEANAEEHWHPPRFLHQPPQHGQRLMDEMLDDDEPEGDRFAAAYDEVVYRDSTSDGIDADMLEGGTPTDFELDSEQNRIADRLAFITTLARLWTHAATGAQRCSAAPDRADVIEPWRRQALDNIEGLRQLLAAAHSFRVPEPKGTHESLVEYDRRLHVKHALIERTIDAIVEVRHAERWLLAASPSDSDAERVVEAASATDESADFETSVVQTLSALLRGDAARLRDIFPKFRERLEAQPILYIPLARGGDPHKLAAAQTMQQLMRTLLRGLPRAGLLTETCQLMAAAQSMEAHRPAGEGAVTEFDRLFEVGYVAIVEKLVAAMPAGPHARRQAESTGDGQLIDSLNALTENLLQRWLQHSRSLRLSSLEKIADEKQWKRLVDFVDRYGHDVFTQKFVNLGNIRAILHEGVSAYLTSRQEEPDDERPWRLLDEVDVKIERREAVQWLTVCLEAIAENYPEYKDFNNTTTQSDRGELLWTFLDFLRLKMSYLRVAWNVRPVMMAHRVLISRQKLAAAELWRQSVAQRTAEIADSHLEQYEKLCARHGMRLPTIGDLLAERFVRPLTVDRLRALVRPAIDEARGGADQTAFDLLEQEIQEFTEHPTGSGLDIPEWLEALLEEAAGYHDPASRDPAVSEWARFPEAALSWSEALEQLRVWDQER